MNNNLELLVAEVKKGLDLISEYPVLEAQKALQEIDLYQFAMGMEQAIKEGKVIPQ